MRKQRGEGGIAVITILGTLAIIAGLFLMDKVACHSRWEKSGALSVSWGPAKGCMVEVSKGRWLPADSIRELDLRQEEKK